MYKENPYPNKTYLICINFTSFAAIKMVASIGFHAIVFVLRSMMTFRIGFAARMSYKMMLRSDAHAPKMSGSI